MELEIMLSTITKFYKAKYYIFCLICEIYWGRHEHNRSSTKAYERIKGGSRRIRKDNKGDEYKQRILYTSMEML